MCLLINQTCLNERLLPNYTYSKIHDPAAHHDTDTQKYRCSLVKDKLTTIKKKYNCKQLLMMVYQRSESTRDNFGKFIH